MNEDRSARYNRLKRRASIASVAWNVVLLGGLTVTGATRDLRDVSSSIAHGRPGLMVGAFVVLLSLIDEIGGLPIAFYGGFIVERRYSLSNERLGAWAIDSVKSFAVGLLLSVLAASALYECIRLWPDTWWLPAAIVFGSLAVGLANLAPVLLLPLFYTVKPLGSPSLRARLLALADRAGARVADAYEWGLGEKTKKANAALAGLGPTRRILVSDTMLSQYSEEEIEVVLAHELAHHVHGDIWKALAFEALLILGGFYGAAWILRAAAVPLGLSGPGDVAGLPLLLLVGGALAIVMLPAAHALSRAYERRADRFALELTKNPVAFISAMRRLGAQNLAEEHPSPLVRWLFYSHPPIDERIASARAFVP